MDHATFDSVAWPDVRRTLDRKPWMYQLWFIKQGSGYCGTGEMLHRWDNSAKAHCPNCGRFETAAHLNRYPNADRTWLLGRSIDDLTSWMKKNYTHPELVEHVPEFLRRRGGRCFTDLGTMSRMMRRIGAAKYG